MEIIPLIDSYRLVVDNFLQKRQETTSPDSSKRMLLPNPNRGAMIQQIVQELARLDAERIELRRGAISVAGPSPAKN